MVQKKNRELMKKQQLINFSLLLLVALFQKNFAEDQKSSQTNSNYSIPDSSSRTVFLGLGIGYIDVLNARLGYQINDNYSASLTANMYAPENKSGLFPSLYPIVGIRVTKHIKSGLGFLGLNSVNMELGYSYSSGDKTTAFELAASKEGINKRLITLYYSLGLAVLTNSTTHKTWVAPSFKIGIYLNI